MGITTLEETGRPDAAADGAEAGNRAQAATPLSEEEAFQARRRRLGIADDAPRIGLALSGGGIRSATFCLGLLRGLARQGVLSRFDYLSTVSGGGYIGTMFGRLVQRVGILQAQAILADSDSRPLWWLRRYGRYLAPGGARDYGIGIATFLRAFLAVHVEFAFLALTIGLATVFLHALHAQTGVFGQTAWHEWKSALWPPAAIVWLLLAPGLMGTYWMLRDPPRTAVGNARDARFRPWDAAVACASAVAGGILLGGLWSASDAIVPPPSIRLWMGCVLSGLGVSGLVLAFHLWRRRLDVAVTTVATARRDLTALLRAVNLVAAVLALLGVLDWASWELQEAIRQSRLGLFGGLGTGGALLVAARAANEPLQKWMRPETGASRNLLPLIVNVLGFGLAFALLVLWATVVQWLVFDPPTFGRCPGIVPAGACDVLGAWPETGALWRWATVCGVLIVWFACTGSNSESANTTSLHNMYAARLVRAYLGSVNPSRFADDRLDGGTSGMAAGPDVPVTEIENDDDPALATYRPAEHGGPLHLVNVCLNQTRGRRTRLFNADRKGVPMVVSAYAAEVDGVPVPRLPVDTLGKLGRWVAISGAAASPGAGAYTSPGWSALLFLGGARLGYWLGAGHALDPAPAVDGVLRRQWRRLADAFAASKIARLTAEFSARFDGPFTPNWYLSDGGHFDNTGVHALLGRKLDFIVLADCGADPDYTFSDLENLVRKARIDHGAEIEFYSAESAAAFAGRAGTSMRILAPEQMADNFTTRGVLLARILYKAATDGTRKQGTLLVVKPNLHVGLDVDVLAYARRNPRFPQQTTGDQFFDEAQWESYHHLGVDFGSHLRIDWLSHLPAWTRTIALRETPEHVRTSPLVPASEAAATNRPFWRLDARQAAVGALSLGAALTLLVPASQALEALRSQRDKDRDELARLVIEAKDAFLADSPATGAGRDLRQRFLVIRLMNLAGKVPRNSEESAAAYELIQESAAKCEVSKPRSVICEEIRTQLRKGSRSSDDYWSNVPFLPTSVESDVVAVAKHATVRSAQSPESAGPQPPLSSMPVASVRSSAPMRLPLPAALPSVDSACRDIVLYVQIYDEASRGRLRNFQWDSIEPRVRMPGIENVNLTAAARNARPPRPYAAPTLVVHDYDKDADCAGALGGWLGSQQRVRAGTGSAKTWSAGEMSIRRLPSGLSGERHVIELWWPPASDQVPIALSP